MMIEVSNRSEESWGPLANCSEQEFNSLINKHLAKDAIKKYLKTKKKMKTYKIHFIRELHSDYFEVEAEDDYDVISVARKFFKENAATIDFKQKALGKWAGEYAGYDKVSYVKVRL